MPREPTIDDVVDDLIRRQAGLRILLAEDDAEMRDLLAAELRRDGYDVIEARNGLELVHAIHRFEAARSPLHLVITDVRMPGFDGLEVLEYMRYAELPVPVIVMTAFGDPGTHSSAYRNGARLVFDKPFDLDEMRAAVALILPPPPAPTPRAA